MCEERDDEKYMLTPWGCLYATLLDYGVDLSHISGRVGTHIVEDFMETLTTIGYIGRVEDSED